MKNRPFRTTFNLVLCVLFIMLFIFKVCGCTTETPAQKNIPAEVTYFGKKLSDKSNPLYSYAKKLYEDYVKSDGKRGLDEVRFHTKYKYKIIPKSNFIWTLYKRHHPQDVVIGYDDIEEKFFVLTNDIDTDVFSPISYVYISK